MTDKVIKASIDEVESQIKDIERDYSYRLVEFSIGELIKKYIKKSLDKSYKEIIDPTSDSSSIIVPEYQRNYVWSDEMKSKFIESILMRIPMPPLFAFELDDEGNLELIDGVQRLTTIKEFIDEKLVLGKLDVLDKLNGFSYSDLGTTRMRKFNNLSLKLYLLDEDTDEGIRADIFNRINSTGEKLRPAEIRKGSFLNNRFYDFVLECTKIKEFEDLWASKKSDEKLRGEKEELITRFFAYSEKYQSFEHSVRGFLNDYIKEKGIKFDVIEQDIKKNEFLKVLHFVVTYFPFGFKKSNNSNTIPNVRFESIAVGVNLALKSNPNIGKPNLKWVESIEYKNWVTSGSSNNKNKLIGRIEFVRDCLLGIIDINSLTYED